MFSTCLSIHSIVHYQTCAHDILKTNEPNLVYIGISGRWGKGMKRSTLGMDVSERSRSHDAEIRHKMPSSKICQKLSDEFQRNMAGIYYS